MSALERKRLEQTHCPLARERERERGGERGRERESERERSRAGCRFAPCSLGTVVSSLPADLLAACQLAAWNATVKKRARGNLLF